MAVAAALSACGGGGGDSGTTPPAAVVERPEGLYAGTLTGGTSADFRMLVLEDGEMWSLYGTDTGSGLTVAGFVQGSLSVSGSSISSLNVRDYGYSPPPLGTSSGTFNKAAGTISGDVVAGGRTVTFSGNALTGAAYDYSATPSLAGADGTWTLDSLDGDTITLNVNAATGALTATTASGCSFTGSVTARASGKNVFDASIVFGAAPCLLAGQTVTGIAVTYPVGAQTQLLVAVQNATRLAGNAAFGVR